MSLQASLVIIKIILLCASARVLHMGNNLFTSKRRMKIFGLLSVICIVTSYTPLWMNYMEGISNGLFYITAALFEIILALPMGEESFMEILRWGLTITSLFFSGMSFIIVSALSVSYMFKIETE